jgi:hypothetical protein
MQKYIPEPFSLGEDKLFFVLDGKSAQLHGAIGYLRADFGKSGDEFWQTWFNTQEHLNTGEFKAELGTVINGLRYGPQNPIFSDRSALERFCQLHEDQCILDRGIGFKIRTAEHCYYFRCKPCVNDYDIYCFAYKNQ